MKPEVYVISFTASPLRSCRDLNLFPDPRWYKKNGGYPLLIDLYCTLSLDFFSQLLPLLSPTQDPPPDLILSYIWDTKLLSLFYNTLKLSFKLFLSKYITVTQTEKMEELGYYSCHNTNWSLKVTFYYLRCHSELLRHQAELLVYSKY